MCMLYIKMCSFMSCVTSINQQGCLAATAHVESVPRRAKLLDVPTTKPSGKDKNIRTATFGYGSKCVNGEKDD